MPRITIRYPKNFFRRLKDVLGNKRMYLPKRGGILQLAIIAVIVLGVPLAAFLAQRAVRYGTRALEGFVDIFFAPDNQVLPPDSVFRIMLDSDNQEIAFVKLVLVFDPTKIQLTSEISIQNLTTVVRKTRMVDANSTGRAEIVLGYTPGEPRPSGVFQVAEFSATSISDLDNDSTAIFIDSQNIQVVDFSANPLSGNINPADIVLNPMTPTPSPTPISTVPPTETPTPQPTFTPTLEPTATSTPTPTVTPVLTGEPTIVPIETPTFTPTQSPTPSPTQTPTPTQTPNPTFTPIPTRTPTPSPTPTPFPTMPFSGGSLLPTNTPTPTLKITSTPTSSPTPTPKGQQPPSGSSGGGGGGGGTSAPPPSTGGGGAPARKRGDVNGDGKVNILDLSSVLSRFNKAVAAGLDLNGDGKINILDLSIILSNWNK